MSARKVQPPMRAAERAVLRDVDLFPWGSIGVNYLYLWGLLPIEVLDPLFKTLNQSSSEAGYALRGWQLCHHVLGVSQSALRPSRDSQMR